MIQKLGFSLEDNFVSKITQIDCISVWVMKLYFSNDIKFKQNKAIQYLVENFMYF